ncbi:hypothetical protein V1L54_21615 [Streptomyces sp. TRM 70361]|uniref:hypothetical protein n=1 Tax=Streptomyces sp. TRM 70361 TaxID=3116553 RepID=UPI002E7BC320|nr:hypothetical protein [Streptomyces sp. TRM 70361]MEE1941967.1 hypothetical protein [Streptomyces sp. TRM 70361]
MSNRAGKKDSFPGPRDDAQQNQEHESTDGSVRSLGKARAAEKKPWRHADSGIPEFTPGTLDAAAILKSVNETLLPVVEKELEEAAEKLGAALAGKEADADLASAFRAELMRRVLPQFTEAVRKGVLESIRTRQMHLAQLAVLHRQALEAKTMKVVLTRLGHEATKAGLQIVDETGDQTLFNVVEEHPGVMRQGPVTFELAAPAYVDKESGKLVERGWLRAVAAEPFPRPRKMTPGQKRRSTHTEADKKPKKGLSEKPGDSLPKKKVHRGQAPGVQQVPENLPVRETGKRDRGADGNRKSEASRIAEPAGATPRSKKSVDRPRQRSRDRQSEQRITSPRSEESSDRQVPQDESRGGTGSPTGSQDMPTGGRTQKKTSYRQLLWAAAGKQTNQRDTR